MVDTQQFPLAQLARFQRGVTWSKAQEIKELEPGAVPVLRIPNIQERLDTSDLVYLRGVREASIEQCAARKDWILMVGSNGNPSRVGNCVLIEEANEFLFASFLVGIEPTNRKRITPEFLFRVLLSPEIQRSISDNVQGSTGLSNINLARLKAKVVRCPPLVVQQRIAEILLTLDKEIEKTESLIAKYQKIKTGLMHDLFTRGVTADGKLRPPREQAPEIYKQTPIGWIPKEWQYELLDDLAVRGSGHTPNKNFPEYWNGGIKWISLADSFRLDQLYISDTEYQISQLGIQNSSAVVHPAGTVVLSRDAGIGKSAITAEPMAVSQHFMCWRCDARLEKYFLYYWLQFKKRMFENIAMGSTILTIGLPYFKKLRIAAPNNLEEQKRIGERLQSADRTLFSLEADLQKKKQQKAGLMHDLLTGKVRVTAA